MSFLLALLLAASTPGIIKFRKAHPCPESCALYKRGEAVPYYKCGACDVDHKWPISCGGPDVAANMHWMDAKANRSKGARDCSKYVKVKP